MYIFIKTLKSLLVVLRYSCPCRYCCHRSREEVYVFHQIEERSIPVNGRVTVLIQCPFKRSTVISFHGARERDYNSSGVTFFSFL
jgi:hypothetical protein